MAVTPERSSRTLRRVHVARTWPETWRAAVPDRAAYLAWGAAAGRGAAGEQVAADETRFLDRSRTRAYVIDEHVTSG